MRHYPSAILKLTIIITTSICCASVFARHVTNCWIHVNIFSPHHNAWGRHCFPFIRGNRSLEKFQDATQGHTGNKWWKRQDMDPAFLRRDLSHGVQLVQCKGHSNVQNQNPDISCSGAVSSWTPRGLLGLSFLTVKCGSCQTRLLQYFNDVMMFWATWYIVFSPQGSSPLVYDAIETASSFLTANHLRPIGSQGHFQSCWLKLSTALELH